MYFQDYIWDYIIQNWLPWTPYWCIGVVTGECVLTKTHSNVPWLSGTRNLPRWTIFKQQGKQSSPIRDGREYSSLVVTWFQPWLGDFPDSLPGSKMILPSIFCEIWKFRKLWREQPLWKCSRRRLRRAVGWLVLSSTPTYGHWTMGNRTINIDKPRDTVPDFQTNPLHESILPCAVTLFSLAVQVSAFPYFPEHLFTAWTLGKNYTRHCRGALVTLQDRFGWILDPFCLIWADDERENKLVAHNVA